MYVGWKVNIGGTCLLICFPAETAGPQRWKGLGRGPFLPDAAVLGATGAEGGREAQERPPILPVTYVPKTPPLFWKLAPRGLTRLYVAARCCWSASVLRVMTSAKRKSGIESKKEEIDMMLMWPGYLEILGSTIKPDHRKSVRERDKVLRQNGRQRHRVLRVRPVLFHLM